ncbi:hypothetical protein [Streptobacillus canis]|uniref:hypothetical protein n=1 Tax=Streptobacillus canis TaxID=2678686 RepID=UPI0012E1A77B|nr:hypothetical protein [Streptobacillus canis]
MNKRSSGKIEFYLKTLIPISCKKENFSFLNKLRSIIIENFVGDAEEKLGIFGEDMKEVPKIYLVEEKKLNFIEKNIDEKKKIIEENEKEFIKLSAELESLYKKIKELSEKKDNNKNKVNIFAVMEGNLYKIYYKDLDEDHIKSLINTLKKKIFISYKNSKGEEDENPYDTGVIKIYDIKQYNFNEEFFSTFEPNVEMYKIVNIESK